ncbi:response regulator transcription factor [Paraburkholderia sp. J67]|uniref:response regulator transcription factor n=1 Tax=Paraburkholderia sp. J67 TaxID=2805435 RepID=UPI002ABE28B1|nr:response regulator transcription factor [Paraburkholderia sp. J67]
MSGIAPARGIAVRATCACRPRDEHPAYGAPLRVIVADDHECVRVGVTGLLNGTGRMAVVAQACDTHALACELDAHACDVVVADVCMPGMHGYYSSLAMLRRLVRSRTGPAVVVLTMVSSGVILGGLHQEGRCAIVDKRDASHALLPAIDAASAGASYLSPFARTTLERVSAQMARTQGVPSVREWEVFQLYAQGMPIGNIAQRFGRSTKTISTQKRSTMRKLGLLSERDLIDFAMQIGLT